MTDHSKEILKRTISQFVQLRHRQQLSHETVAKKAQISRAAVSYIESGKRSPSLLTCLRIAAALDTDLSAIIKSSETQLVAAKTKKPKNTSA